MAPVNPNIQTGQPQQVGYFQPITPYSLNRLGEQGAAPALEGIGKTLEDASKGINNSVESIIDQGLYKAVDTAREGFTGSLEQAANVPLAQRVADYNPDVLGGGTPATAPPPALQATSGTVQNLGTLMNNKPGMGTYFLGRLDMINKDMRTQFPGWRDYVDKRTEAITGFNPANEYYKNLESVIQASLQNNKTEQEKNLTFIRDHSGYANAELAASKVQSGEWGTPDVIKWASKYTAVISDAQQAAARRDQQKNDLETLQTTASQDFTKTTYGLINHSAITLKSGMGDANIAQVEGILKQMADGTIGPNDADGKQLQQALHTWRNKLYSDVYSEGQKVYEGSDKSIMQILGPTKYKENVDASFSAIDQMLNQVDSKEYGPAYSSFNTIAALTDDRALAMLTSDRPSVQKVMLNGAAITKLHGPQALGILQKDYIPALAPELKAFTDNQKVEMALGKKTMTQAIEELKRNNVGKPSDSNPSVPPRKSDNDAYNTVTNVVNAIADPDAPDGMKGVLAGSIFGPGNEKLLDQFQRDYIDDNGKIIRGQHAVFNKLTQPDVRDKIYDLKKTDPGIWDNYKVWVSRNNDKLFRGDVKELGALAQDPNIKISWNGQNHNWDIAFTPEFFNANPIKSLTFQNSLPFDNDPLAKLYQHQVAMVNSTIAPLAGIAEKEGTDVDSYVLKQMKDLGLDPTNKTAAGGLFKALGDWVTNQTTPEGIKKNIERGNALDNTLGGIPTKLSQFAESVREDTKQAQQQDMVPNAAHVSEDWGNPLDTENFSKNHLTTIHGPSGDVTVNKKSATAFSGFLKDLEAEGYKFKSVGGYSLRANKSNPRMLSQHAFGNAIDINSQTNPYGQEKNDLPSNVGDIAAKWGLSWGGAWHSVKDPMHFEYTGSLPQTASTQ